MTQYNTPNGLPQGFDAGGNSPPSKRGMPWWGWLIIVLVGGVVLFCAGGFAILIYVGAKGPDTKVYTGNEVPAKFVNIVRELNLLDAGEQVRFFYSDAVVDIEESFTLATDKKVVIYMKAAETPATIVPYDKIAEASLESSGTWIEDGTMTLELHDGSIVSFPVSSEGGRDKQFHEAILSAMDKAQPTSAPNVE